MGEDSSSELVEPNARVRRRPRFYTSADPVCAQRGRSAMDAASVDNVVAQYLKKRGYAQAEAALKAEAKVTGVTLDDLKNRYAPPPAAPFRASAHPLARLKLESDAAVVNYIMFYNQEENARTRYEESYTKFRDWVHTSLDLYKPELLAVLFPVFVHCYLDLIAKSYLEEGTALHPLSEC